ncbi:hypothetical protein JaAD80_19600 [Janthinobacterium sp. AD80]|nr:hypothetical protein JaAD80_19600 [Janthinobacterium sp. AD80]
MAVADIVRHGRQVGVDVFAQRGRRQLFGDGREAPHVGEQHRQFAVFAIHGVALRIVRHLGHQFGRHVFAEARHQRAPLAHLEKIAPGQVDDEQRDDQQQHHGAAQHQVAHGVQIQVDADGERQRAQGRQHHAGRRQHGQRARQQHAEQHDLQQLERQRIVGTRLEAAVEDGLDQVGMHLHARIFRVHGRGADIVQTGRRGPHQHDGAFQQRGRHRARQHGGGGDIAEGAAIRAARAAVLHRGGQCLAHGNRHGAARGKQHDVFEARVIQLARRQAVGRGREARRDGARLQVDGGRGQRQRWIVAIADARQQGR